MKIIVLTVLMFSILSVNAIPPGKEDNIYELTISEICAFDGNLSKSQVKKIKEKAMNGDSIAAKFLFSHLSSVNNYEMEKDEELKWLKVAEKNGNPIAMMHLGSMEIYSESGDRIEEGISRISYAAEYGLKSAIWFLATLYEGKQKGLERYKNKNLSNYWHKRLALVGNLFNLKGFVINNPNNLPDEKLKDWRDAYEYLRSSQKELSKDYDTLSSNAQWLVRLFNRNRNNLTKLLKQNHEVYAGYKYCKNK